MTDEPQYRIEWKGQTILTVDCPLADAVNAAHTYLIGRAHANQDGTGGATHGAALYEGARLLGYVMIDGYLDSID